MKDSTVADVLNVTVCQTDPNLKICQSNKIIREMFGYTSEDVSQGLSLLQLFDTSQIPRVQTKLRGVLQGRNARLEPFVARKKDGSCFVCECQLAPLDEGNVTCGFEAVITDVTDKVHAQEDMVLKRSHEWFRFLYKNMPGGHFLLGDDLSIQDSNDFALKLLEYDKQDLQGKNFTTICPDLSSLAGCREKGRRVDDAKAVFRSQTGRDVPVVLSARRFGIAGSPVVLVNFLHPTELPEDNHKTMPRGLHDAILQKLAAAKMNLSRIAFDKQGNDREWLDQVSNLLSDIAKDVHNLSTPPASGGNG